MRLRPPPEGAPAALRLFQEAARRQELTLEKVRELAACLRRSIPALTVVMEKITVVREPLTGVRTPFTMVKTTLTMVMEKITMG